MGTTYSVVAVDRSNSVSSQEVRTALIETLAKVNAQLSNWDADSEISHLNKSRSRQPIVASPALTQVIRAADTVSAASEGQFDLTLGPLIELWGFGAPGSTKSVPTETEIADALASSGQGARLTVGGRTIKKPRPETQIYVSGLGKGHGADRVAMALSKFGIKDYMVEIGGDLVTAGRNPNGSRWQIGIEAPSYADRTLQKVVGLSNVGVATSGDYRNYFEHDGKRYSHILDARAGRPITHKTASTTVVAENAMLADAWSTAMLVVGRRRGLELAEEHKLAALFLERNTDAAGRGFVSFASPRFHALVS